MKTINTVVAAMALSTLSFGVFAAEPVTASQAQNMNKIGVVSADGASTLDALEADVYKRQGLSSLTSNKSIADGAEL